MNTSDSLISGTLDLVVLYIARDEPTYAYRLAQEVSKATDGALDLKEGSLYPALQRLEEAGLLHSYEGASASGRRRKYYKITADGKTALAAKRNDWQDFTAAVRGVLSAQPGNPA